MDIPILFQDDQLMVINKPPGLVVDSSETQKTGTLQEILEKDFGIQVDRGGIVHRLDKDTSGLMIVAKTQTALETLQLQFKERMVKKEYLALCHGFLEEEKTVSGSIGRNPRNRERFIVLEEGKEAETKFVPEKRLQISDIRLPTIYDAKNKNQKRRMERGDYGKFTLVRCLPLTGRTHQIRVHLKYIGFPLVGDEKYAGRKTARLDKKWCPRQFLHAAKLQFYHPVTGERLEFESGLPDDLQQVMEILEVVNE
jgi:23S rRNA pseudouridine1911/1915/1917 synthase